MFSPLEREKNYPSNLLDSLSLSPSEAAKERFVTCYTETCPRQIYGVDANSRLQQLGSLKRQNVLRGMVPNSVVCFDSQDGEWFSEFSYPSLYLTRNGNKVLFGYAEEKDGIWFLKDFFPESVDFTQAGWVVPVGAWGSEIDVMKIIWNNNLPMAINDLPDQFLSKSLHQQAFIINELSQDARPVYWGVNNSAGTLYGRGLMTVLYPHIHIWKFSSSLDILDAKKIKAVRESVLWDEGLSTEFASRVVNDLKSVVSGYWDNSVLEIDNMGFSITLFGFTSYHLADLNFIRKFWEPLSLIIDCQLKALHSRYFESDLSDIYEFVRAAHYAGEIDGEVFARFFHRKNNSSVTHEGVLLDKFANDNLLRYPPGWAGSIQFNENGAFVTITFGFLDIPMGPVEGNGVRLVRLVNSLSKTEMEEKTELINYLIKASMSFS